MIPINRENVRDVILAVLCIAAACGLFYLAGCGKPAGAENLPPSAEVPLPIKGGGVVQPSKCLLYNGTKWVDCPDNPKMPTLSPPKCPNKLPALAVMIADPSFPDVWRGAYLCNTREIVPGKSGGRWRYADQKRYGYQVWGQK